MDFKVSKDLRMLLCRFKMSSSKSILKRTSSPAALSRLPHSNNITKLGKIIIMRLQEGKHLLTNVRTEDCDSHIKKHYHNSSPAALFRIPHCHNFTKLCNIIIMRLQEGTHLLTNVRTEDCDSQVLLDFNTIGRRHFTRYGQHLTMGGKRLLARLVVASLRRTSLVSVGPSQPPPPLPLPSPAVPAESPSIAAAEPQSPPTLSPGSTADTAVLCVPPGPTTPWTLPHDSYAEAVRSSPPNERRTSDENTKSKAVF
ncbi:hypothetical protein J6590_062178 [Homalodisca vitripennis]|nr:hypothetical protein J6590_062178 [Homalodisca vitripennis]